MRPDPVWDALALVSMCHQALVVARRLAAGGAYAVVSNRLVDGENQLS